MERADGGVEHAGPVVPCVEHAVPLPISTNTAVVAPRWSAGRSHHLTLPLP